MKDEPPLEPFMTVGDIEDSRSVLAP